MTLRLRWVTTVPLGRRWELNAVSPRARFIGRLLVSPTGTVSAAYLYRDDAGLHRWKETTTATLRDGAVLLIARAKELPPKRNPPSRSRQ